MENTEIIEIANGIGDSVSVADVEICAVAVILFAIGCLIGAIVFNILSKRWHT